jgi:glucans biosynthesis protein C
MNTQTIALPAVQAAPQTRAVAVTAAKETSRLVYLDTLRAVLCVLVILVHTAIAYGSKLGDWTFIDHSANNDVTAILFSLFVVLCQTFFMGLFFFISGYFIPRSIDHKGQLQFWKDRLLRLGFPFLAYTLVLSKLPNYLYMLRYGKAHLSFLEYCRVYFWQDADAGPTWFLFALLVFSLGYSLWRLAISHKRGWGGFISDHPAPRTGGLLLFALAIAAGMWGVAQVWPTDQSYRLFGSISLMLAFFPQYLMMFVAGILAYRNNWLADLSGKYRKLWAGLAILLAIAIGPLLARGGGAGGSLDVFWSGIHWQSVAINLWAGLYSVSMSLALILWLRDRQQTQSRLMSVVSASTFSTYLIHPLILVPISFALSYLVFCPLAKFILVGSLAVSLSFALGIGLRRIPGLKAIL